MKEGYATPFQGNDCLIVSLTNTDATVDFGKLLGAVASKRWTVTPTDFQKWTNTFGIAYPEVKNCQILLTSAGAFQIARDGATFEYAAGLVAGPFTLQTLSNFFILGTAVKVFMQF